MATTELHDNLIHRVNVGDSLTRTAARLPNHTAIVDGRTRLTYAQFNAWVNQVANGLLERGYRSGDVLALASGNSAEFLVTYYACAKTGVVCVPMNLGWRSSEVSYVLSHSGARGVVVESQLFSSISEALLHATDVRDVFVAAGTTGYQDANAYEVARSVAVSTFTELASEVSVEPEVVGGDRAPLTYLYTSGTTAAPKGVVGNHTAIYLESVAMALEARFGDDDRFVAMMPMFHTAQLNCHCTSAVMVGAAIHIQRAFDAETLLATIESDGITQIFGLPMMYQAMLDHPDVATRDLSTLRRALYAMAPMPQAQLERCIDVFGCGFYLLFGQTEMSPTTTLFRPEHQLTHNGAAGTPIVNVQVAIMDDDGNVLPQGASGEIVYRGPQTMSEYLKNPEATAEAFEHGWFHSGDLGHFDEDGLLWFTDRKKDVIKTGGENVASIEVEKALFAADPNVAEVAVVGLPHPRWTEAITAVVVPRPGTEVQPDELVTQVKAIIDSYKAPKSVIVADHLPRTSTGKIQKHELRNIYREHYSPEAPNQ